LKAYERLIRYAGCGTASDSSNPACPSTPEQLEFGKALVEEMKRIGIQDANMDENGYVFGTIPSNTTEWKGTVIGFISHMDVVRDVPYQNVKPRVVRNYDGSPILLNQEKDIFLRPEEFDSLNRYKGCDLVVTDGTTLLGADDKAGIAEIMTMAETLCSHPELRHGTIKIGFTPDEEIGRGADLFDIKRFGAHFAYTVDGGAFGEVEYETFNAASADIRITGRNIHPGTAKGRMKNAMRIAMEFNTLLPEGEVPEKTEKYQGFHHLTHMKGTVEEAELNYILRDHDAAKLEQKKEEVRRAAEKLNRIHGAGTVCVTIRDEYQNMSEQIKPHRHLIETAYEAVRDAGGDPVSEPVRGGTDGSRLSFMGLPCPNLGTGSHNHHGKLEYACVQDMDRCVSTLIRIAEKYCDYKGN